MFAIQKSAIYTTKVQSDRDVTAFVAECDL